MHTTNAASTRSHGSSAYPNAGTHKRTFQSLEDDQRERISKVLDLARVYRGCRVETLARHLGRDPTRLITESGNPKVDFIAGLAQSLEWPIEHVIRAIRGPHAFCRSQRNPVLHSIDTAEYHTLNEQAIAAHRSGEWEHMLTLGNAMIASSRTPDECALGHSCVSCAHDGMGRYGNAIKSVQQGLSTHGTSQLTRFILKANLANAHYVLWHLVEAHAISNELIQQLGTAQQKTRVERAIEALAFYVRGNSIRRMISDKPDIRPATLARAKSDLTMACNTYIKLSDEFGDDSYRGIANTCAGAVLEIDAASEECDTLDALTHIEAGVTEALRIPTALSGDHLESWGWWSIFGANIALRHLPICDTHQRVAQLHQSLLLAAEQNDHWGFRATAFELELRRRDLAHEAAIPLPPWTLEPKEMEKLVSLMGRIPAFQPTGWRILTEYRVLDRAVKIDPRTWRKGLCSA